MANLTIRFPFDRSLVVGEVEQASAAQVEAAIATAVAAFERARRQPAHARAAVLARVSEAITRRREELAETVCLEAGKPITFARGEVDRAAATFSFAAEEARRMGGEVLPLDAAPAGTGRTGLLVRVPRGPVAAITPFNFPLNLAAHKIAPALAVGATVVHKPSPETPLSALKLAAIVVEAGAEPGTLSVVVCGNEEAAPLVDDARLPVLSFTGSAAVGWALKARAPRKQVTLELGGNAAVVVEPDADWRAAAGRIVTAAFAYAGQVCIKAQRILLHEDIADEMTAVLVDKTRRDAKTGDPRRPDVMLSALIRSKDADRVVAWIDEARQAGAQVLCGGGRQGDVVEPTLLGGVPHSARVSCQEVFGPVAVIERYRTFDEALALVNDSPYGLQAGVYTRDIGKVFRALRELDVGAVIHDDTPVFRVDHMPYGGVKESGWGREGLRFAMEEMTEPRLLVLRV